MNGNGTSPESNVQSQAEQDCKLHQVAEAIQAKVHPEEVLGMVACVACYGIFNVHLDAGQKPTVDNVVFVPCMLGYSNNPEAHLEG